jgi:hypothetical protein
MIDQLAGLGLGKQTLLVGDDVLHPQQSEHLTPLRRPEGGDSPLQQTDDHAVIV